MTATLDRELLARIGTVLYGEHWQAEMARTLGKSNHTVSRWSRGVTRGPSLAVWQSLSKLLNDKLVEGSDVWSDLAIALDPRILAISLDHRYRRPSHEQPSTRRTDTE